MRGDIVASKGDPRRLETNAAARFAGTEPRAFAFGSLTRRFAAAAVRILHTQAWFIGISLMCLAAAFATAEGLGRTLRLGIYGNAQLAFFLNLAVVCITLRIGWVLIRERPARPLRPVWHDLTGAFALDRRLANAVPALILLPLILSAYTSMKTMIPAIAPFAWDARLAAIDTALHGGIAPWALIQPLLGSPRVTHWLDWAYGPLWFWLLLVLQFWQTFTLHAERTRFFMTFVLSWALLGTVMATAFASAGPVYYGAFVTGPDPFEPLMAYLGGAAEPAPLLALQAQADLWRLFMAGDVSLAAGISAMPSMHISMGTLLVLATWRLGPLARAVSCLYLAVLLIGSVHLAWHYAIDGYAAVVGTWAIWWAAGRALDWRIRRGRISSAPAATTKRP